MFWGVLIFMTDCRSSENNPDLTIFLCPEEKCSWFSFALVKSEKHSYVTVTQKKPNQKPKTLSRDSELNCYFILLILILSIFADDCLNLNQVIRDNTTTYH